MKLFAVGHTTNALAGGIHLQADRQLQALLLGPFTHQQKAA